MYRWILVLLVACACPSKQVVVPATGSGSSGPGTTPPPADVTTCEGARPNVEALYLADAQQRDPNRVAEAVTDNTHMAMNDCAKDPAKIAPCLGKATSVAQLEKDCLIPLDDEGTEGRR